MKVQVAHPAEHAAIADLPFEEPLVGWHMPNVHKVLGLHRHVVKLVEFEGASYVVKELPDDLAEREYRLLRAIADDGLPTAEMVAVITGRGGDGMVITRHLDYSLPYRSLLMGRGLKIPYLGDRLLDALVVLLVRIHLAGYFWGDCSLSNTLFRRDAGALQAYIIDVETAEHHDELTAGQRSLDLMVATDNVAGGLLDLQAAGRLSDDIDPIEVALAIEERYHALWRELTEATTVARGDVVAVRARLDRLHELGFDIEELELVTTEDGAAMRYVPRVVEHGYHRERLASLTGLETGENQARRMLNDIRTFGVDLQHKTGRPLPENVIAVRWLDQRFEPIIEAIPLELRNRLEPAEIFHQLLEHRWYMTEHTGGEVSLLTALGDYLRILESAPEERVQLDDKMLAEGLEPTGEIRIPMIPATEPDEADEPRDEPGRDEPDELDDLDDLGDPDDLDRTTPDDAPFELELQVDLADEQPGVLLDGGRPDDA